MNKLSKMTHVDLQKRFLENHARCKFESRLSNPPGSRGRRNNAGWIVTWNNCPLRTHSTSLKWCSTNFLTENSSSRNSWSLFNSSNFWILLTRESRSARSRSANSSWSRACSRLDCSYPVRVCPISTAWESICLFNSQIFFSARSAQYSCLRDLGFCFCEQLFSISFQNEPELTVVQLLVRFALLWHPDYGSPRTYWKLTVRVETSLLFVSG